MKKSKTRYVKNPLKKGKNSMVTYCMFGLLGVLATACYYRAINIGKSAVLDDIVNIVNDKQDCLIGVHENGKTRRIRCSLYEKDA